MQIERHQLPDGCESLVKRVFDAETPEELRKMLAGGYRAARKQKTLREVKQVEFDPDDPCPCGSKKKAKNCCAGRLLRRLRAEKQAAEETAAAE